MGSGTFIHRLPILKAHGVTLAHFVLGGEDQARSHPPRFGREYLLYPAYKTDIVTEPWHPILLSPLYQSKKNSLHYRAVIYAVAYN